MNPKKHPLEIFKKHGTFSSDQARKRGAPAKAGAEKKKRSSLFTLDQKWFGTRERKIRDKTPSARTPGDRRISLSLNQVLFVVVIVMVISLCTYFLGYHKGLNNPSQEGSPVLKDVQSGPGDDDRIMKSQSYDENIVKTPPAPRPTMRWGIQVGQYSVRGRAIAEQARDWLDQWLTAHKKTQKVRLSPLRDRQSYIIIVGSFADKESQELKALLKEIQSIDDYPYGSDKTPFADAQRIQYKLDSSGDG